MTSVELEKVFRRDVLDYSVLRAADVLAVAAHCVYHRAVVSGRAAVLS